MMAAHRQDVLEREARRLGGWPVAVDLTSAGGSKHLVAQAVQAFGVDILVFNRGGPPPQLVLLPLIRLVGLALPYLRSSRSRRILAVSSIGIREPTPNIALSNSIRPGMHGYLKTLSNELAPEGITVNILAAGRLATARMSQIFPDGVPPEQLTEIPMGRWGTRASFPTWPAFWHRIAPHQRRRWFGALGFLNTARRNVRFTRRHFLAGGLRVGQEEPVTLIARRMRVNKLNCQMSDIYLTNIIFDVG